MSRRQVAALLLIIATLAIAFACAKPLPVRQYPLKGKVVRLVPENRLAAIQHEAIAGWMEAMTMEFPVPDAAEFAKLQPGLEIEATVNVRDLDYWLTGIRVVSPR